jgi:hypothetical protein
MREPVGKFHRTQRSFLLRIGSHSSTTISSSRHGRRRIGLSGNSVSGLVRAWPSKWSRRIRCYATPKIAAAYRSAGEVEPIVAQTAGAEPTQIADAARYNVSAERRSSISTWDARQKVCNIAAGLALLQKGPVCRDPRRGGPRRRRAGDMKILPGWNRQNRNVVRIARIAEHAGIAALSVHGRTRECGFTARSNTTRYAKSSRRLESVIANGDVDSPEGSRRPRPDRRRRYNDRPRRPGRPGSREIRHFLDRGERLRRPGSRRFMASFSAISPITALYANNGDASRAQAPGLVRERAQRRRAFAMKSTGVIRQRNDRGGEPVFDRLAVRHRSNSRRRRRP